MRVRVSSLGLGLLVGAMNNACAHVDGQRAVDRAEVERANPPPPRPLCPEAENIRLDLSSKVSSCVYIASPPVDGVCEVFVGEMLAHVQIPLGFADHSACGRTFWCACDSFVFPQIALGR